jgi:hypothetical protein
LLEEYHIEDYCPLECDEVKCDREKHLPDHTASDHNLHTHHFDELKVIKNLTCNDVAGFKSKINYSKLSIELDKNILVTYRVVEILLVCYLTTLSCRL